MSHPSFELNARVVLMNVFHKAYFNGFDGEFNTIVYCFAKYDGLKKAKCLYLLKKETLIKSN